jgi:hypothetical protein
VKHRASEKLTVITMSTSDDTVPRPERLSIRPEVGLQELPCRSSRNDGMTESCSCPRPCVVSASVVFEDLT